MAAAEGARRLGLGEAPVVPRQMEQADRPTQQKVVVIRPQPGFVPTVPGPHGPLRDQLPVCTVLSARSSKFGVCEVTAAAAESVHVTARR